MSHHLMKNVTLQYQNFDSDKINRILDSIEAEFVKNKAPSKTWVNMTMIVCMPAEYNRKLTIRRWTCSNASAITIQFVNDEISIGKFSIDKENYQSKWSEREKTTDLLKEIFNAIELEEIDS